MSDLNVVSENWIIGLLECGDISNAVLPCCCPCIGFAMARSNLDQSDCCFNLLCMNSLVITWLVRSAYGMQQNPCGDLALLCCCTSCVANQVYQTTLRRKNPSIDGGLAHNQIKLHQCGGPPCHVFNACCCSSCTNADALQRYIGMPWWMGCCCINSTAVTNVLRFHYRLADFGGCSCCYVKCCGACVLATTVFHADSVGKTSDRYLVRTMTTNINPAGVMQYGFVEQPGPAPGQVLQQPQYDPSTAAPIQAMAVVDHNPVQVRSKPQPAVATSSNSAKQVVPLTTATMIGAGL